MRNPMSPRFWKHAFALWWLCVLACGGEPTRPTGPLVLTAVSGPQQARVGQMLPAPLQIRVRTSALDPVPHVVVQWRADAGALAGTVSSTDANGVASMQWRLDTIAGEAHAFASVDSAVPVSFTGLALPGTPLALTITPANVSAEPRSTVQLSATGADRYGNAVLASQVIWSSDISIVASVSPSGLITGGRRDGPCASDGGQHRCGASRHRPRTLARDCRRPGSHLRLGRSRLRLLLGHERRGPTRRRRHRFIECSSSGHHHAAVFGARRRSGSHVWAYRRPPSVLLGQKRGRTARQRVASTRGEPGAEPGNGRSSADINCGQRRRSHLRVDRDSYRTVLGMGRRGRTRKWKILDVHRTALASN